MFRPFAERVAQSQLSKTLQDVSWIVPLSQSMHIVALSVLFASVMMISLRLLGVGTRGRSASQLAESLLPWMWRALTLLILTGALQTFIEPVRQFITPIFWLKMCLVALLSLMTWWFSRTVRANASQWATATALPARMKLFAVTSIVGWSVVIVLGRFIGYVWANYL